MTMRFIALLLFLNFFSAGAISQENFTINGVIRDIKSTETLIGVNLFIEEAKIGITTNEYGFYSITLPKGSYTMRVSFVGYEPIEENLYLNQNTVRNWQLSSTNNFLTAITVESNKKRSEIRKPEMSVNRLSIQTIKQMPVVLGEVDIIKSILLLPGVTNAGEGQSGFNVRGGSADQNLILLDEATIYNSSHLFGFVSVFNSDAIKDLKLYKGGIPARFGGRLSSVLDIYQKEGNNENTQFSGGIGIVSSRLLAEGPIVKEKSSFLVAGRASYGHLFLKLSGNKNSAYFYDLNTKMNYKINQKNNLYLSGYFGRDVFDVNGIFTNVYGNSVFNLRWNHLFSEKLFSNLSLIYNDYDYGLKVGFVGLDWKLGIQNFNLKYDFKHYLGNSLKLTYGINAQYYNFNPGTVMPIDAKSGIIARQLDKKYAFEPAVYFDVEQKISANLMVNYGLRNSAFYRLGSQTINLYNNDQSVIFNTAAKIYERANPIGTKYYGNNETIASFNNFEPRFSFSYMLNNNHSVKASYNRMVQYLHLISNTQSPTPLDLWTPSDNYLKPQILDQFAIGYFSNFKNDLYSVEIEAFYKKVKNRIDYIDGAELIANNEIEQVILNGKARSYGLEMMVRKNTGKLTGWVSYTLSRSEQQIVGRTPNETGINNGKWYNTAYDKLHNLSVTGNYTKNNKWSFGFIFSLQSGQPTTVPEAKYDYRGINVPSFGLRNANRLPLYHHLDVSATYIPKPNKTKGWRGEWVFGIYNLYNRQNAASISFRQNQKTAVNEAVRFSIFGIIPSVTYNFKF